MAGVAEDLKVGRKRRGFVRRPPRSFRERGDESAASEDAANSSSNIGALSPAALASFDFTLVGMKSLELESASFKNSKDLSNQNVSMNEPSLDDLLTLVLSAG